VRFRWPLRCGPCCPAKLNRIELLRCACIAARYCRSVRRENCKCAARGDEPRGTTWPELETTRRTIPRGRLPHGSKCEILAASECFQLFPQGTKSLRSSPLRGSKSREAGGRSRGQRWAAWQGQHDQLMCCRRATHDQEQQGSSAGRHPDAASHSTPPQNAMTKLS
jgi:hypothetical protein